MKVEIYSDVACPWCYIGKRRFERALADFADAADVEVVFRPYQLDPEAPAEAEPMEAYLARRFGPRAAGMTRQVADTARNEGLTFDYARGLAANTFDAHRVLRLAEADYGPAVQRRLAERLFEAHFAEGRDVSDADVLTELAAEAGMDAERTRADLAAGHGRADVADALAGARRLGITAVPTFVFDGRYAVQGAQPPAAFLQALETVAREAPLRGSERGDG